MNLLRKVVTAVGGFTVIALVIGLAAPKAAHGLVATLVQVANTTSNPVPVSQAPTKTVTVTSLNTSLDCSNPSDEGPFDVSAFSTIRFIASTTTNGEFSSPISTDSVQFQVNTLDSVGNQFPLDTLTTTFQPFFAGTQSVSNAYQMPGNSVQVHITAACTSAILTTRITILGR